MEKDHQGALEHYQRSLAISTRTGSRNLIATTYKNMAILARQTGDYTQQPLTMPGRQRPSAWRSGCPASPFSAQNRSPELSRTTESTNQAFDNLLAYITLKDSLDSQENRRRAADLQIRFESERKENVRSGNSN